MFNFTNESKISKDLKKEALITRLFAINFAVRVIQAVIISINAYEQKLIEIGKENENFKNRDKWNYFHHMPILLLFGASHCLPLLYMSKRFICIE